MIEMQQLFKCRFNSNIIIEMSRHNHSTLKFNQVSHSIGHNSLYRGHSRLKKSLILNSNQHFFSADNSKKRMVTESNQQDCTNQLNNKYQTLSKKLLNLPLINPKQLYCETPNLNSHKFQKNYYLSLTNRMNRKQQQQNYIQYCQLTCIGKRMSNEDRVVIQKVKHNQIIYQYFAIFDGHGGHLTSSFLAANLHISITECLNELHSPTEAIKRGLIKTQQKLKKYIRFANKSGSCALICLATKQTCWIANIGDSRLISIDKNSNVKQITQDHKPQVQSERKRIQNCGGRVYRGRDSPTKSQISRLSPFRLHPGGLSVSRTIGDFWIKKQNPNIISSEPQIFVEKVVNLDKLILFSDGLYQKLNNNQIAQFFLSQTIKQAVNAVFDCAQELKSEDNRSIIGIKFV